MAKKRTEPKPEEPVIREGDQPEEYFRPHDDSVVLPPELNITIKDGFRFGIGFILASVVFYVIVIVGIVIVLKFGSDFKI